MNLPDRASDRWLPRPSDFPGRRPLAFMMTDEELANSALFRMGAFKAKLNAPRNLGVRIVFICILILIALLPLGGLFTVPRGPWFAVMVFFAVNAKRIESSYKKRRPLDPKQLSRVAGVPHRAFIDILETGLSPKEFADSVWACMSCDRMRYSQGVLDLCLIAVSAAAIAEGNWNYVLLWPAVLMMSSYGVMCCTVRQHPTVMLSSLASRIHGIHKRLIETGKITDQGSDNDSFPAAIALGAVSFISLMILFPPPGEPWLIPAMISLGGLLGVLNSWRADQVIYYEYNRMLRQLDNILYWIWRLEHDPPPADSLEVIPPKRKKVIGIGNNPAVGGLSARE